MGPCDRELSPLGSEKVSHWPTKSGVPGVPRLLVCPRACACVWPSPEHLSCSTLTLQRGRTPWLCPERGGWREAAAWRVRLHSPFPSTRRSAGCALLLTLPLLGDG